MGIKESGQKMLGATRLLNHFVFLISGTEKNTVILREQREETPVRNTFLI